MTRSFGTVSQTRAQRPLSITVIGLYMLFGAYSMLTNVFTHAPAFLLGLDFRGWKAAVFFLAMGTLDVVIGIGLLRLTPWSRVLAIYFFLFRALNTLLTLALPVSRARFEESVDVLRASRGRPPAPWPVIWFGTVFYLCLVLWFLITRKEAFFARPKPQVSGPPIVGGAI